MTTSNADHAQVGGKRDQPPDSAEDLRRQLAEARRELDRLRNENQQLRGRLGLPSPDAMAESQLHETAPTLFPVSESEALPEVDARSPLADKVALVRRLFRGQDEVYAVRWVNPRSGKAGYAPAVAGGWNGRPAAGKPERHLPLTDEAVGEHLKGSKTIGVYPLRKDDTCWFLACDFDGGSWALDAAALWRSAAATTSLRCWSAPALARAGTYGSSSPRQCWRLWPVRWDSVCCARPCCCGRSWIWPATTGSSQARTCCPRAASGT
jgi:hypothetical protein